MTRPFAVPARLTLALFMALSMAVSMAAAQQRVRFEVEMNSWDPDLTGQMKIVEGGIGDSIDLIDDLAMTGDRANDLRITFHPSGRTEIRLARMPIAYTGDNVASRTIEFAGETFTVSSRVVSNIDLDYVRAGFAWQFLSSDDRRFRAGPLLEIKGFQGDASLGAPDLGAPVAVGETFEVAYPAVGIAVDLEPSERLHFFGEASTLVGTDVGDQTDFEVGVRVPLWGALTAQAGYRSITIDVTDKDDAVKFDMDSVFIGLGLRF